MSPQATGNLRCWVPEKIIIAGTEPLCQWLHVGGKAFTEPFFDDTIAACRRTLPRKKKFRSVSNLDMMADWAPSRTGAPDPAAIIFHVSRCGSTLLSQLLGIDSAHTVLSEVPFFDELLRLPYTAGIAAADADRYLQAAIRLYGQKRQDFQERLFIKTDSWHIHFYERWRSMFPVTPFILLYRDPVAVIHSQQRQRGRQSVPGLIEPQIFGFAGVTNDTDLDRYMADVLASYFKKMIRIIADDPFTFAFDYSAGMISVAREIYRMCRIAFDQETGQQFAGRSRYHAKNLNRLFSESPPPQKVPGFLEPVCSLYRQLKDLQTEHIYSNHYSVC